MKKNIKEQKPTKKLRTGDQVQVIRGKFRGEIATIRRMLTDRNRVELEGSGLVPGKKHVKPGRDPNLEQGGRVDAAITVHLSNVLPIDPESGKGARVGMKILANGQKVRVSRKSGQEIVAK